jgi:hypothetical protein
MRSSSHLAFWGQALALAAASMWVSTAIATPSSTDWTNGTMSLLTGPVWFNERAINGDWKWTTQLDVNVPF